MIVKTLALSLPLALALPLALRKLITDPIT